MGEEAFGSTLRITVPSDDPAGELAAGIRARVPHADVVLDPTGELAADLAAETERPVSRPAGVGGPTDASDPALAVLRHQVVDPVVAALFRGDEVETVTLARGAGPCPEDVWVRLVARGEPFEQLLHSPVGRTGPIDLADVAQNLAWNLEDFIAESRFGWGQQRIARYDLPAAHDPVAE